MIAMEEAKQMKDRCTDPLLSLCNCLCPRSRLLDQILPDSLHVCVIL